MVHQAGCCGVKILNSRDDVCLILSALLNVVVSKPVLEEAMEEDG